MQDYCIYLRKSRADIEAESHGEGETLARHRARLMELAVKNNYDIGMVYEEIVSGDTIAARPQMQKLLEDVEKGKWKGVLVTEVERLARGDTIDQGIVAQTFKYSNTLIITPMRIYNPGNEFDEEYFEFGLFMARREYSAIKRRMQAGRIASAKEGKFQAGPAPFGYRGMKLTGQKGNSLEIVPEEAQVVKMIFDLYLNGVDGEEMGSNKIAIYLNELGLKTRNGYPYEASHVRNILINPTYIGKIRWNQRVTVKGMYDGVRTAKRKKCDDMILADGLHEPIIDEVTFKRAQAIMKSRNRPPKVQRAIISNPLAGLVKCGICGYAMVRKENTQGPKDFIACKTHKCPTTSIHIEIVENALLETLEEWVRQYNVAMERTDKPSGTSSAPTLAPLVAQLSAIDKQMDRLHDLLESGVYSAEEFIDRRAKLTERKMQLTASIEEIKKKPVDMQTRIINIAPRAASVLEAYKDADSIEQKNKLLRSVIERVDYHKTRVCYRNDNPADYLKLYVYPKGDADK